MPQRTLTCLNVGSELCHECVNHADMMLHVHCTASVSVCAIQDAEGSLTGLTYACLAAQAFRQRQEMSCHKDIDRRKVEHSIKEFVRATVHRLRDRR